jgi:hypothetical protein
LALAAGASARAAISSGAGMSGFSSNMGARDVAESKAAKASFDTTSA